MKSESKKSWYRRGLEGLMPKDKKDDLVPCMCLIASMIAKAKNRRLNVVQELLSVVVHAGHASKQVCMHAYTNVSLTCMQAIYIVLTMPHIP